MEPPLSILPRNVANINQTNSSQGMNCGKVGSRQGYHGAPTVISSEPAEVQPNGGVADTMVEGRSY